MTPALCNRTKKCRSAFIVAAIPALMAVCFTLPALLPLLYYDRIAILDNGQWWRLWTGHFTHSNQWHLWLNLSAWAMMFIYARNTVTTAVWIPAIVLSTVLLGICLLILQPQLTWYTGLSGVLHGFIVLIAVRVWFHLRDYSALFLLVAIACKIVWEQWSGPSPGTEQLLNIEIIVDAHLYGVVIGILLLPLLLIPQKKYSNV